MVKPVLVLVCLCGSARAEPQIELGAGLAVPFINKDWRNHTDPTGKIGARPFMLWPFGRWRIGWEAMFDASVIYHGGHGAEARGRALAGTRIGVLVRPAWLLYARGALGVDYITSSGCDNAPRFALDVGLGLVRERSPWRFGGQIDIPVAAGDTGEVNCFFVPTVSHDFDFLATAQHAL